MSNEERKSDEVEVTRILNEIHGIPESVKLFAPVGIDRADLAISKGMKFKAWLEDGSVRLEGSIGALAVSMRAYNGPSAFSPVDALKWIIDELSGLTE
jgi:hypothetical protein